MNSIDIIKSHEDFNLLHSNGKSIPIKIAAVVDGCQVVYKFWNRDKHEWIYNIQPLSFFVMLLNQERLKMT